MPKNQPGAARPWPIVNPAEFRTPITFLAQAPSTDISGATVSWSVFAESWAQVKALRGADVWKAGQFTSEKYMQARCRYQPGILAKMRITFLDQDEKLRTLQIVDSVNVEERGIVLEILCVELDGQ